MTRQSLVRNQSSKLLQALLDNPELPAFIPQLATPTLNKLIKHLGPEDAGHLIVHTTNQQLRAVLDESLWQSLAPGAPETHRPEEFIRWLFILQDQGEETLAERLYGLGIDYSILNFSPLIQVNGPDAILSEDYQVLTDHPGGASSEEFSGYFVAPVHSEEWDITRAALIAIQTRHPVFFTQIMYRMSRDAGSTLMHDISGNRRDRKESSGFVSPESATAFLELIHATSLQDIVLGENYDPVSTRYFYQLGALAGEEPDDDGASEDIESHNSTEDSERTEQLSAEEQIDPSARVTLRRQLEALLIEAEVLELNHAPLLLSAPEEQGVMPIKQILSQLQHSNPEQFAQSLQELAYLSNVLVAGTTLNGKPFENTEAAEAVMDNCNLGISYLGYDNTDILALDDGLVRLFRVGWKLLMQLPVHVADILAITLRSQTFIDDLYDRRWILEELESTLAELMAHAKQRRFSDTRDCLAFVSLVVGRQDSVRLTDIIADYPQFPLDPPTRGIRSAEDLQLIDAYVRSIVPGETE